ncbi:hypothetical protein [Cesiribacter sp. SM1]|uniref:hypothetical protein n=1 Tax=Cesiribacter sp. SM1 TaxID=2861196 RepID=UPI001CD690C7|nr:hypothetical protein [Cesiribacter sp. SM1]
MGIGDFVNKIKTEVKVIKGDETKDKLFSSTNHFSSIDEAVKEFLRSKEKLFHVNDWSKLPGISSGFKLYDAHGAVKETAIPQVGDFIFIDLPGPSPETWVEVIDVKEEADWAEFTVSPSHDPREQGKEVREVEHFFADEATSTFRVERKDNAISACEIGMEEGVNNRGKEAGGREIVNTVIAVGGWILFQEIQWRKLTDYLVHKIELEE